MTELELKHYGVLGMKWGVRRYQNTDGTLTAKGKKRYSGEKAYQGKMSVKETETYAKTRIAKRGARQALEDEKETERKATMRTTYGGAGLGAAAAIAGGIAGGIVAGPAAPAIAAGMGIWGGIMGSGLVTAAATPALIKRGEQAVRNVDAIKRIADIPDATVGERRNVR